ncbi:XAP5 protein [Cavenderia fasciculata]|uniref:XAP5 protein n=1 Tax=Cavenderia fasciculata TaxID=261658 RepID=F4QCS2_CACFS|nr:XAP5 protein [Cavenderia fasciculata]EGG13654.1 XAP5 protein [Cavenderia fasciculata]|eukprot:XP_004350358.1 XAP5 protein [Cavenderia fasciculata]
MAEFKGGSGDGNRIRMLEKQRGNELKELNKAKEKIKEENKSYTLNINQKFESANDQSNAFKNVGLVSMSDFQRNIQQQQEQQALEESKKRTNQGQVKKVQKKAITKNKLSFDVEDDDDEDDNNNNEQEQLKSKVISKKEEDSNNNNGDGGDGDIDQDIIKKKLKSTDDKDNNNNNEQEQQDVNSSSSNNNNRKIKFGKDPRVNTDFLPDKERDELERLEREKLIAQWTEQQNKIKEEKIEITYSYWDGSGHRRSLQCNKGTTIEKFLAMARLEFKELRGVSVDHLIFIKEDLIIPQNYSFYDMIIEKARGKSGPLFKFDVHEDIRLVNDATVEKDESHAAKVVEKSWYERNKHIFPASRWVEYQPGVDYGKYTISDKLLAAANNNNTTTTTPN